MSIAIVTPAWNCSLYIEQMVKSILKQTYTDWWLVIVDDGSTDKTLEVARHASQQDPRIVLLERKHAGYVAAFNTALDEALKSGAKFIARQDADDTSDPTRLEKELHLLLSTDVDLVSCGMVRYWNHDKQRVERILGMDAQSYISARVPTGPCCASILAKRAVYERVGGFDETSAWSPDSEWNFRVLSMTRPTYKWGFLDEPLYIYRDHPCQMTKRGRHGGGDLGQETFLRDQAAYAPLIQRRLSIQVKEQ